MTFEQRREAIGKAIYALNSALGRSEDKYAPYYRNDMGEALDGALGGRGRWWFEETTVHLACEDEGELLAVVVALSAEFPEFPRMVQGELG